MRRIDSQARLWSFLPLLLPFPSLYLYLFLVMEQFQTRKIPKLMLQADLVELELVLDSDFGWLGLESSSCWNESAQA